MLCLFLIFKIYFLNLKNNTSISRCDGYSPFAYASYLLPFSALLCTPGGLFPLDSSSQTHWAAGFPLGWVIRKYWQEIREWEVRKVRGFLPVLFLLLYLVSFQLQSPSSSPWIPETPIPPTGGNDLPLLLVSVYISVPPLFPEPHPHLCN